MTFQGSSNSLTDTGSNRAPSIDSMIPIGDPVQIICQGKKYMSVMRGVVAEKYLLTDIPSAYGKSFFPDYGSIITVRFLLDGAVYDFKTGIVRIHEKSGLIVLEYPDETKKVELRKSKRVNVMIPVVVSTGCETDSNTGQTWTMEMLDGAILDISEIGALIAVNSSEFIDVGHKVTISATLPGGSHIDSLDAEIRNVKLSTNRLMLGVFFNKINDQNKEAINAFYNDCMAYEASAEDKG